MSNFARLIKLKPAELFTPSVLVLIAANLGLLYGVFYLDWPVFPVLVLFWMENLIIGVFNVFKMAAAAPGQPAKWVAKIFLIPFFCFHYGMFTMIHGLFVFGLFGGYFTGDASFPDMNSLINAFAGYQLLWPFLALLISHTLSFIFNYIGKGEYKQASLNNLMNEPYGRVVILHLTIIFGGFIIMALGSPAGALVLLILLKTFVDIQAHVRQHAKYRNSSKQPAASRSQAVQ